MQNIKYSDSINPAKKNYFFENNFILGVLFTYFLILRQRNITKKRLFIELSDFIQPCAVRIEIIHRGLRIAITK